MPHKITLTSHLTSDQLFTRYRRCYNPAEKLRWKALYLIAAGGVANTVAKKVGRSSGWITNLARRYNNHGEGAVASKAPPSQHKFALSPEQERELEQLIENQAAADGGLWTGRKVCEWMREQTGREVHLVTGWRILRRLQFTLQVPRPVHTKTASEAEQEEFKKTVAAP